MRGTMIRLVLLLVLVAAPGSLATAQSSLTLEEIAAGLSSPLFVTGAPDGTDRLFIVEQGGQILLYDNGQVQGSPYLDISGDITSGGETGLLGLAFHPDFANNGRFFVNFTQSNNGLQTVIAEFAADGDPATATSADGASRTDVLVIGQPFSNHNAGMLAFGPNDGYLYIGTGDGGFANDPQQNGQDLNALLGKMLRIDVDELGQGEGEDTGNQHYDVPPDNPFVGMQGAQPEIWAYGLRNPYRYSFDSANGDLYLADVGQGAREEINYQLANSNGGENYGWVVFEGTRCNTDVVTQVECDNLQSEATFPIHEYTHNDGFSVTGGYVYRGSAIPDLQGTYFFADYGTARVWSFEGPSVDNFQERTDELEAAGISLSQIASFGTDSQGELYIVSLAGAVYKIVPVAQPCDPEGEAGPHTADQSGNFVIELSELLRVLQFFNALSFHCDAQTEDGYAVGDGAQDCPAHDSDYNPFNWRVSLSEVLRLVQIYNLGGYSACQSGEDCYCVSSP